MCSAVPSRVVQVADPGYASSSIGAFVRLVQENGPLASFRGVSVMLSKQVATPLPEGLVRLSPRPLLCAVCGGPAYHRMGKLGTGRPENCFARGGWHGRPAKEGGGAFQKWASVPGPFFCVRTDLATKGAGTQILARKNFFHDKIFPHICVVKMMSATWGSF